MLDWIQVGGLIGVHCGLHARGPVPRPRAPWGTGGARAHERGAHSGLFGPPPSTWIQPSVGRGVGGKWGVWGTVGVGNGGCSYVRVAERGAVDKQLRSQMGMRFRQLNLDRHQKDGKTTIENGKMGKFFATGKIYKCRLESIFWQKILTGLQPKIAFC